MGIKQRHERDRDAVRRAILDAARDLFVSEGYQNVSLRKIAERIEYSPAAIYGYFAGKDDIFFALAEEGFRLLGEPQRAEAADAQRSPSPLDRLRGIFWHFYEFSRQHPQYFLLMFVDHSVPRISREYERFAFAHEIKGHCVAEIQACVEEQLLPDTVEPYVVLRLIMMGLVGVAMMRLSDRLGASENADLLAEDMLNVILAGLRSGVAIKSTGSLEHTPDESDQAQQAS
jgi:AcrR family transcriptional regulator